MPYVTVSKQKSKRIDTEEFYKEEDRWLVRSDEIFEGSKIIEFLNKRLESDVRILFPFTTILFRNVLFFTIIMTLLVFLKFIRIILLKPAVWFSISMIVYVICSGGVVYSIIHGVPWFKFERNEFGSLQVAEYFMRGQRGQWAGEGYIVSVLHAVMSLLLIGLARIDYFVSGQYKRRLTMAIILGGVFVGLQMVLYIYRIKSSWYGPTFFPPGHYTTGSLMKDQGNNI